MQITGEVKKITDMVTTTTISNNDLIIVQPENGETKAIKFVDLVGKRMTEVEQNIEDLQNINIETANVNLTMNIADSTGYTKKVIMPISVTKVGGITIPTSFGFIGNAGTQPINKPKYTFTCNGYSIMLSGVKLMDNDTGDTIEAFDGIYCGSSITLSSTKFHDYDAIDIEGDIVLIQNR